MGFSERHPFSSHPFIEHKMFSKKMGVELWVLEIRSEYMFDVNSAVVVQVLISPFAQQRLQPRKVKGKQSRDREECKWNLIFATDKSESEA